MKIAHLLFASAALFAAFPLSAEEAKTEYPSPPEIVAAAKAEEWVVIAPSDLLVMDLAADAKGKPRRVVIQLMPAPFSQGWIGNIRKLAAAKFWDGTSVNRVQDNYVVQWGDANGEDSAKAKQLPEGLKVVGEAEYTVDQIDIQLAAFGQERTPETVRDWKETLDSTPPPPKSDRGSIDLRNTRTKKHPNGWHERDAYNGTG